MAKRTGITMFDLDEGELFSFGYDLESIYRFMRMTEEHRAVIRAQRAGAEDEHANPYYDNIVRRAYV